ncbi:unnamed protein product [Paramecium pentaurelia]|uniref:VLIG-type G domain-containing protein n=1 Tax=Paramecium pentaurelia TaxID=43138 RepID=A0A8S1TVE8_9CILI|nr:unnamed protein product [Paramecium pentaurelia]
MNQGFPKISNSDVNKSLLTIFQRIKNKKYIRSVFILKDLKPIMEKLDNEEKQIIIEYMQKEFKDEEFLKHSGYVEQPNYKQLYQKARNEKDKQLIFQQLRNPQFIKDNEIHDLIYYNEKIVCRLEENIFDLLDLNEFRLGNIFITQIELLKILISFFFLPIMQDKPYLLEQIIGSQLIPQIYQFQYYLEIKQNANQISFDNLVQIIQHRQLQLISKEEFENTILKMKDYNFFLIINSLIEDHQAFREILVQKFCQLLNCTQQQLKVESILSHLLNIENINEEIEELYFCIIFYFWMKYLIKYDIEQGFSDLQQINIMAEDTIETKEQAMQIIIQEQIKSNQDQILLHFVYKIFYFSKELSVINIQEYQRYKQERIKLQEKIGQNCSELSLQVWKDITQLQYCQLNKIQGQGELIKFFWITQLNSEIFMIINNLLIEQQSLNLFEIAILLENKLKETKLNNTYLIISNILMLLPNNLSNVEKTQKILLIQLYLKYNTFNGKVQNLIKEIFFQKNNTNVKDNKFIQLCERFFELDEQQYEIWLESVQYFKIFQITPKCLKHIKYHKQFPTNQKIAIEQFSFQVPEENNQQLKQAISNWVKCMSDNIIFDLFPFFIDILKRGESINLLVKLINEEIFNHQSKSEYFNSKSLFQIFYNNSNQELKFLLLKYRSNQYPIPLIYQTSFFNEIQRLDNLYEINDKIYYLMQKSVNIINLSLSKIQSKIGKTELINNIFYKMQKFEIGDNCQINESTIDVMFDFEFNGTRKFMIADTHGYIPQEILIKILPLFQICIIQIDSENELQENIDSIKSLQIYNSMIIYLLIRNSRKSKIPEQLEKELTQLKINYFQVSDLSQRGIDKQVQLTEIESVSKFLLNNISENQYSLKKSKQLFLNILQDFNKKSKEYSEIIIQNKTIFEQIKVELLRVIDLNDGFYNQSAFPLRHSDYQNKILHQKIIEYSLQSVQEQTKIQQLREDIEEILMFKKFRVPSTLLILFQQILQSDHVQYLWFLEKLRQFNEKNTQKLNEKNQNLIQKRSSSFTSNSQIYFKTQSQDLNQQLHDVANSITQIENELKFKKIGIEIFWRELIQFECLGKQLSINPIDALCQIIRKGEPFELLDGDSQTIDKQFLKKLIQQLKQDENQKVLVLSVLGPQSSGKSTLWNKIFGCHFWTSVGRCTRGINIQLIKVRDKSIFGSLFDQILLLDTEGLQSPNQTDIEFDQKMSLFILAISDITLLTVKGDIHLQFHNLIEICIYQYGQLIQNIAGVKQIVWCFNQNNDVQKKGPFFEQIQQLAMRVEKRNYQSSPFDFEIQEQQNQQIDYANIIDIDTKHIWVLGFAQIQNIWDFQNWTQQSINETFSKNAYQNGIIMIKNYMEKFELQNDINQLQTLSQFLLSVDETWKNIEKLPDYLEFSELLQYYQNKQMKIEYQKMLERRSRDFEFKNLIRAQINEAALKNRTSEEFFKQLEDEKMKDINIRLNEIQKYISQELQEFKQSQKISKKIYLKYSEQLERQINNERLACKLIITEAIIQQKILYDKDQSLQNLGKSIRTLYDYSQNKQLDEQQILEQFEEKWDNIVKQFSQTLDIQFDKFQMLQYEIMKGQYNEFILRSTKEFEYLNLLRNKINKTEPSQSKEEQKLLFKLYFEELKENQFRPIVQTDQKFINIYEKPIKQKIEEFEGSNYINFLNFYICQMQIEFVRKENLEDYLQNQIIKDFRDFQIENQSNQINVNFFSYFFDYFQLKIEIKLIGELLSENQDDNFEQLKNYFQQIQIPDELEKQSNLNNFPKKNYKNLKISELREKYICSEVKAVLKEMHKKFYIISQNLDYEYNVNDYNQYRSYIDQIEHQSKNQRLQILNEFSKQLTSLMEKEEVWDKIYGEAYNLVEKEMNVKQDVNKTNNEQVSCFNMQKINIIIQKLNVNLIQNKLNTQISYFGVILNKLGERCIIYFCLLIIWRFISYSQWQSVNKYINELNQMKLNQIEKTFAYLQENKTVLSIISARDLFNTIKQNFESQFYINKDDYFLQQIDNENFNPVVMLDQELRNNNQEFIINYISDQKSQIEKYVDNKLADLKTRLNNELQKELNQEYEELIKNIKSNAQLLQQYLQPNLNIEEYFENTKLDQDLETKLFEIVVCFLKGDKFNDNKLINYKQRYIFYQNEIVQVQIPLNNLQNTKIQFLDVFVNELIELLKQNLQLQLDLDRFNKQEALLKKRQKLIGCDVTCQFCNRKCDLQYQHQSSHKCQYGHFLIVNMNELEQQFSCDEYFQERKGNNFQQFKQNWSFEKDENKNEKKQLKQDLIKIWQQYGEKICQILQKKYKKILEQINQKKIHYIFILDSSGSMSEDWSNIKIGVRDFISKIKQDDQQNNSESKVSLIIFDNEEIVLKNSQRARKIENHVKMNFLGGGTNLSNPIKKAIKIINKDNFSELYLILFHTDGRAAYPQQELQNLLQLNQAKREKIQLIACTQNANNQNEVLNKMINFFNEHTKQANLFTFDSADDLIQFWSVVINFKLNI